MQDSSSSFALTAFIVAAIKENKEIASQFGAVVDKGIKCLTDNFDSLTKTHDIAVATYALSLANHANQKKYLDRLVRDSNRDDTGRYWSDKPDVEIAGYALLAYMAQNSSLDALPFMKWLNRQRYSTGEFAGVQSTFVALKALGKMATRLFKQRNDYRVSIKYGKQTKRFDITALQPLESIRTELPENEKVYNFEFEGYGFGYFQLTWQYHLNIQVSKHHKFALDVDVLPTSNYNVQDLRVCLSFIQPEAYNVTGTTLVEVYLPSGLEVNENAVRDTSRQIKKTERAHGNTAMFVYYNALSNGKEVCFEVTAHRKFKIAMQRPSYVVVYDTNNRAYYAIKQYEGKVLQMCDICDADDCKSMNC